MAAVRGGARNGDSTGTVWGRKDGGDTTKSCRDDEGGDIYKLQAKEKERESTGYIYIAQSPIIDITQWMD